VILAQLAGKSGLGANATSPQRDQDISIVAYTISRKEQRGTTYVTRLDAGVLKNLMRIPVT